MAELPHDPQHTRLRTSSPRASPKVVGRNMWGAGGEGAARSVVQAHAGDLVLWDAQCRHGATLGSDVKEANGLAMEDDSAEEQSSVDGGPSGRCQHCGRSFDEARLQLHQRICARRLPGWRSVVAALDAGDHEAEVTARHRQRAEAAELTLGETRAALGQQLEDIRVELARP